MRIRLIGDEILLMKHYFIRNVSLGVDILLLTVENHHPCQADIEALSRHLSCEARVIRVSETQEKNFLGLSSRPRVATHAGGKS
jgi:hypothetical protein